MKQKVKLLIALLSETKIILLDEPCSNLDQHAIKWYHGMIEKYSGNKIIVVCSNSIEAEFDYCNRRINVMEWK